MSKSTITDAVEFPSEFNVTKPLFAVGIVGLLASGVGYYLNHVQFFYSYLTSFVFFTSIALGALILLMIHHITRSSWGVALRRIPEVLSSNIWIWAIFIIPVLLGLHSIYHWTHDDVVAADKILKGKTPYLNEPFFIIRQIIYFTVWGYMGYRLHKSSVEQDETGDWGLQTLQRKISGPGILIFAITVAFASFDWLMSVDPHWFSTMFGVYFFAMSFQVLFPVLILMVFFLHRNGILNNTIRMPHLFDLGMWFFAFTIFYAYIAFSQLLLIYYANMPEETLWFYHRLEGSWKYISYALIFGRFVIPFLMLLNRSAKKNPKILLSSSILVVAIHYIELYWIVMPALNEHGVHISWMDISTLLGLGGIFFGLFFYKFKRHKMVPVNDPNLPESLDKHYTN